MFSEQTGSVQQLSSAPVASTSARHNNYLRRRVLQDADVMLIWRRAASDVPVDVIVDYLPAEDPASLGRACIETLRSAYRCWQRNRGVARSSCGAWPARRSWQLLSADRQQRRQQQQRRRSPSHIHSQSRTRTGCISDNRWISWNRLG